MTELAEKLRAELLRRAAPRCWTCGAFKLPTEPAKPVICDDCLPSYQERKFVWVQPSPEEVAELLALDEERRLERVRKY